VLNGTEVKMVATVVGCVDGSLLGANVVRPDGLAKGLRAFGDEATAGKEVEEGW
jgi:hypothetical protein